MNWRWLIMDHVPSGVQLTKAQRAELTKHIRHVHLPLSLSTEIYGFFIGLPLVMIWFMVWPSISNWFELVLGPLATLAQLIGFWGVLWFVFAAVNHLFRRKHTYVALRKMGFEICAPCGYWLRGLGDDVLRCPECGATREPMPATSLKVEEP